MNEEIFLGLKCEVYTNYRIFPLLLLSKRISVTCPSKLLAGTKRNMVTRASISVRFGEASEPIPQCNLSPSSTSVHLRRSRCLAATLRPSSRPTGRRRRPSNGRRRWWAVAEEEDDPEDDPGGRGSSAGGGRESRPVRQWMAPATNMTTTPTAMLLIGTFPSFRTALSRSTTKFASLFCSVQFE